MMEAQEKMRLLLPLLCRRRLPRYSSPLLSECADREKTREWRGGRGVFSSRGGGSRRQPPLIRVQPPLRGKSLSSSPYTFSYSAFSSARRDAMRDALLLRRRYSAHIVARRAMREKKKKKKSGAVMQQRRIDSDMRGAIASCFLLLYGEAIWRKIYSASPSRDILLRDMLPPPLRAKRQQHSEPPPGVALALSLSLSLSLIFSSDMFSLSLSAAASLKEYSL